MTNRVVCRTILIGEPLHGSERRRGLGREDDVGRSAAVPYTLIIGALADAVARVCVVDSRVVAAPVGDCDAAVGWHALARRHRLVFCHREYLGT